MTRFLLALIALLPLICSAEIYNWTNENGHAHFGDKPKDKDQAKQLSLKITSYVDLLSRISRASIRIKSPVKNKYAPIFIIAPQVVVL